MCIDRRIQGPVRCFVFEGLTAKACCGVLQPSLLDMAIFVDAMVDRMVRCEVDDAVGRVG